MFIWALLSSSQHQSVDKSTIAGAFIWEPLLTMTVLHRHVVYRERGTEGEHAQWEHTFYNIWRECQLHL